ncbi:uncharacterized protein LOC123880622 isoform X2 [Maniola jurtina]|uniref:uncharacterized protein LOC123880622 isoform X2 n=1 Tax=Maniola jurtina TaxID=191418 RepID=UPI001E686DCC|nr:uncharacterized protein LOC123880622 isoform X2 [Maniola jurtina]
MDVNISEDLPNTDDNNNCSNIIKYPDVTGINPINISTGTKDSASDIQLVDYEKPQKKQLKRKADQRNVPLPKTCDDFQQFSYMRDPTQPIQGGARRKVQAGARRKVQGGSETLYNVPSDPTHVDRSTIDTSPEPLFNMQTKTPLQQSNVNNTSLDFTVQTVPTATALPDSAGPTGGAFDVTSPLPVLELCDLKMLDLIQSDLSSSSSVMPDSAGSADGASDVTYLSSSSSDMPITTDSLSEMFENALQIISHDSDYMESIGMSKPAECILCCWAGSILLLDGHIRKDHACSIKKTDKTKWKATYTLKSLMRCNVWHHDLIEYDDTLYLLSVKYKRPNYFMATFSLLSLDLLVPKEQMARMTLFNKRTGESFSWTGHIPNFPAGSPSKDGANGLITKLDLFDLIRKKTPVSNDIDVKLVVRISNKNKP